MTTNFLLMHLSNVVEKESEEKFSALFQKFKLFTGESVKKRICSPSLDYNGSYD